jgi:hypothetical protein
MLVASAALLVLAALQASAAAVSPERAPQTSSASLSLEPSAEQQPVSLSRIRRALETESDLLKLDGTQASLPTFRTEIRGRRLDTVLDGLDFRAGPVPLEGVYAFEQAQILGNPWAGRAVAVNILPLVQAAHRAISNARRGRAERAAQAEVQRALVEFCGSQANCPFR